MKDDNIRNPTVRFICFYKIDCTFSWCDENWELDWLFLIFFFSVEVRTEMQGDDVVSFGKEVTRFFAHVDSELADAVFLSCDENTSAALASLGCVATKEISMFKNTFVYKKLVLLLFLCPCSSYRD
jgi:hypothetical protein